MTDAYDYTRVIEEAKRTPGAHLAIGRGGATLYYAWGARLSSYAIDEIKRACLAAGLPVIDSRNAPIGDVARVAFSGPLVAVGEPPGRLMARFGDHQPPPDKGGQPWRSLDSAPLAYVADLYRDIGAEVLNCPTEREET